VTVQPKSEKDVKSQGVNAVFLTFSEQNRNFAYFVRRNIFLDRKNFSAYTIFAAPRYKPFLLAEFGAVQSQHKSEPRGDCLK
jgi:hypothetical protein